jgi:hypothetical protein
MLHEGEGAGDHSGQPMSSGSTKNEMSRTACVCVCVCVKDHTDILVETQVRHS